MPDGKAPNATDSEKGTPGVICKTCEAPIALLKPVVELGDPFDSSCPSCGDISTYYPDEIVVLDAADN